MGSRAVVVLCRDESVSQRRFGVVTPALGTAYTRTGRRFFNDDAMEIAFLTRLRDAAEKAGLWAKLATEWLCLDCELMPWSVKAQELLRQQYAPVGNSGLQSLAAEQHVLAQARERVSGLDELAKADDRAPPRDAAVCPRVPAVLLAGSIPRRFEARSVPPARERRVSTHRQAAYLAYGNDRATLRGR